MNPNTYQRLAARTLIDAPEAPIPDGEIMLVWNAIGLAGEAGEICAILASAAGHRFEDLERLALLEEVGDLLWYAAGLCTKLDAELEASITAYWVVAPFKTDPERAAIEIAAQAGAINDMIKKAVFHRHGVTDYTRSQILQRIGRLTWHLGALCAALSADLAYVMAQNIEKLRRRYPDGYSTEASLARVDREARPEERGA